MQGSTIIQYLRLPYFFSSSSYIVFIVIVDSIFHLASSSLAGMCFEITCLIKVKYTLFIELHCVLWSVT